MSPLQYFMGLQYTTQVLPDEYSEGGPCYIGRALELPGCESHGDSPEEALANLQEAMELYIQAVIEDGLQPPAPSGYAKSVIWRVAPGGGQMLVGGDQRRTATVATMQRA